VAANISTDKFLELDPVKRRHEALIHRAATQSKALHLQRVLESFGTSCIERQALESALRAKRTSLAKTVNKLG
jgi:hypothetical protein